MVGAVFAPAGAQIGWLVLAVVLHVCGQVSRGVAWRGVLAATWPEVTRRRVCAWYVCGAGSAACSPPRGGDAVRVTLARRELRRRHVAGARRDALRRGLVRERVSGLTMMLAAVALGVGSLHAPPVALLAAAALAAVAVAVLAGALRAGASHGARGRPRRSPCCARPGHCARHVLPFQAVARVLRLGSATCFLLAFGLPVAPAIVRRRGPRAGLRRRGCRCLAPARPPSALRCSSPCRSPPGTRSTTAPWRRWPSSWPAALTVVGVTLSLVLLARLSRRADAAGARARRTRAAHAARTDRSVTAALGWGALAASSLVVGALLGLARDVARPRRGHRARLRRRRARERGQLRPRRGGPQDRQRGRGGRRPRGRRVHLLRARPPASSGARRVPAPARRSPSARSSTASPSRRCSGSASPRARA